METIVFDAYPKVSFDEFLPELSLEIPELPDDIIMNYVRSAAIEFAERTHVLQRELTICLQPCVGNYILESPDCTRIVALSGICRSCDCGGPVTRLTSAPCWVSCFGLHAWWERPGTIWFQPAPTQPDEATVRVSVAPTVDACEVDAVLLTDHKEAIQAGARARIYNIPRRPWSSVPFAEEQRREFDRRVASAGTERLLGGNIGAVKMKTIFSGRGR